MSIAHAAADALLDWTTGSGLKAEVSEIMKPEHHYTQHTTAYQLSKIIEADEGYRVTLQALIGDQPERSFNVATLTTQRDELLAALEALTTSAMSGDEARLMLVAVAGTKVSKELHARCDAINTAFDRARAALAKAKGDT